MDKYELNSVRKMAIESLSYAIININKSAISTAMSEILIATRHLNVILREIHPDGV